MTVKDKNTFIYFAYGSNMFKRRLRARTPSAVVTGIGYVGEWRLAFDKDSKDGSSKCNIHPTAQPTDRVYGVLYEIDSVEERELDKVEGLNNGYRKELVQVITSSGTVQATTYIATVTTHQLRPYHWYKALVIAGAQENSLPQPYVEWLRTVESQPDPDAFRRTANEALLFAN